MPFATFLFGTPLFAFLGVANIFFIVALPIIGFIQFAARYVFKRKTNSNLRSGMFVFWIVNIISFFGIGSLVFRDFNQEKETVFVPQEYSFTTDSLQLTMGEEIGKNSLVNFDGATIVDDNLVLPKIGFRFEKSEDEKFRIFKSYFSRGKNSKEIEKLTSEISYEPIISNNEIIFPSEFIVPKGSKWRGQEVKLTIAVPQGKTVKFGNENRNRFSRYIDHYHSGENKIPSVSWHGEHVWTMQENGWYSKPDATQEKGSNLGFKNFKSVRVKGDIKVEITKGDVFEVKVTGKERGLKTVNLEQIGDVVHIETSTDHRSYPVRLFVTAPHLESIDVDETNDVKITGFDGKKLSVSGENSHEVKVFVNVDSLSLNFRRTKSDIRGKGKFLKAKLNDSRIMDAEHFVADNAYIIADHTRKIKVEVVDTLQKDLSGGSRISFEEDPKVIIDERQVRREKEEKERRQKANRQ